MKINEITGFDSLTNAIKRFSSTFTRGLYGFILGKFRQAAVALSRNPAGVANIRIGDFVNSELAKINNINVQVNERLTGGSENLSAANNVKLLKNKNSIQGAFVELGCCIALGRLMSYARWTVDTDSLAQIEAAYQEQKQRVDRNSIPDADKFIATLEEVSNILAQRIFYDIREELSVQTAKSLGFTFRVTRVGQSGDKPDIVLSIIGPEHPRMKNRNGKEYDREKNYSIKTKLGQKPNYTIKLHDGSLYELINAVWSKRGVEELEPQLKEFKELTGKKNTNDRRGEILKEVINRAVKWNNPIYVKRFVNNVIGAGIKNMRTYIATAGEAYNAKSEVEKFNQLNTISKLITADNGRGVTMTVEKENKKSIQVAINVPDTQNNQGIIKFIVTIGLSEYGIGIYATVKKDVETAPGNLPPSPNAN